MREVTSEKRGLISPGIVCILNPARTWTPSYKHKYHRGVTAKPPGGSAIPSFSPNTHIHNHWLPVGSGKQSGKAGQSDTWPLPEMKHPRCEARGQVAQHERKVAVFVCLEKSGGEGLYAQDTCFSVLLIKTQTYRLSLWRKVGFQTSRG
jgi:hypothetical protein